MQTASKPLKNLINLKKPYANLMLISAVGHWELSHTITTHHLLSLISVTNTLTSVSNASFVPEQERKRKLVRQATHGAMDVGNLDISFSK